MGTRPRVTVILPTYNERECLLLLAPRLDRALAPFDHEFLVVDDSSPDGTADEVRRLGAAGPYRLLLRPRRLGLASAVLAGFTEARGSIVVVMDADGSHPPELIPELIAPVAAGAAEFVLGSRHMPGAADSGLSWGRRLMSGAAARLVHPLTPVTDPMSGFFALDRRILARASLRPAGFKIGLEVIVKCRPAPLKEVPFHFGARLAGESKLGAAEVGRYLRHVGRLYLWTLFGARRASSTR